MATSRSTEDSGNYVGGASIYSGRPDPTWEVNQEDADRLLRLWSTMQLYKESVPSAPVLGYRGCFLRDATQAEWFAYGGVVTMKSPKTAESRYDKNRKFEAKLISTAPPDLIPPQLLEPELKT